MVGKLDSIWMMWGSAQGSAERGDVMTDGGSCSARKHVEGSRDGYGDHQFAPLAQRAHRNFG